MKTKILTSTLLLLFFSVSLLNAQGLRNLSVAVTTENYAFPFTRIAPIHPGLELGTNVWIKDKDKSAHQVNVLLGGYYHRQMENGFYLLGEYVYTYKFGGVIGVNFPVGIGYQHVFYPGEVYEQDTESGEWEQITQFGKPRALANFGIGLTFLQSEKIQPFIRYQSVIDFPLYPGFLTTRTVLKLGLNITL